MTRIITVTSGKRGVGKTCVSVNLAAQLAQRGQRVCVLDVGSGPATASALLGIASNGTLRDLAVSDAVLADVLVRDCCGIDIVPAGPGSDWITVLAPEQLRRMAAALGELDGYDFILIDSSSAIAQNMLAFALASPEIVMLITPDSRSLTDAYSMLKLLFGEQYAGRIHSVVNKSINQTVGKYSYDKFKEVANFYLEMQIPLLGLVGEDHAIQQAVEEKRLLPGPGPGSRAVGDIGALADRLLIEKEPASELDIQRFCNLYLQATGINEAGEPEAPEIQRALQQPVESKQELQNQLDYLSGQVDHLIEEIEWLRAGRKSSADLFELPKTGQRIQSEPCDVLCIAAELADESEQVSLLGETFSIFHMDKTNGDLQWYACHSLHDDLEKPEPKTTSS